MKKLKLTRKREAWAASRSEAPIFKGDPLAHNAAAAVRYVGALSSLTAQMTAQVTRDVLKLFKTDAAAAHFGQDATIASQSRILLADLGNRFNALFAKKAKPLAESMVKDADKASTPALHSSLQKLSGGMSLKTSAWNSSLEEIYKASVAENVSLIKSIASEYLQKVEGAVMRSITTGNGLQDLVPALEQYEGMTHRRAKNIALDQTRKVYNSINRGRMEALGVQKFMWHHSGGGAHPREDHVEMDGEIFSFEELPIIDERTGERGIPGQAPNCLPGDTLVDLSNGCDYIWRYFYEGDLLTLEFDGGSIRATPKHPFLTQRGWVAAENLQLSDYFIQAKGEGLFGVDDDVANRKVTIEEVFLSVNPVLRNTRPAAKFDFHGEIPDGPVEEVRPDFYLTRMSNPRADEGIEQGIFAGADGDGVERLHVFPPNGAADASEVNPPLRAEALHPQGVGLTSGTGRDPVLPEDASNDVSGKPEQRGNGLDTRPLAEGFEHKGVESVGSRAFPAGLRSFYAASAERLAEIVRVDTQGETDADQSFAACYSLLRIQTKRVCKFSGFVHTLQSSNGWFKSTSAGIITKNCRCTMSPVFDFSKG